MRVCVRVSYFPLRWFLNTIFVYLFKFFIKFRAKLYQSIQSHFFATTFMKSNYYLNKYLNFLVVKFENLSIQLNMSCFLRVTYAHFNKLTFFLIDTVLLLLLYLVI